MSPVVSPIPLGSEFDAFLFATIGEEKNGQSLSVVSALARMDLDPWQEAASLSALPADAAAQRVAALFQTLPNETLSDPNLGALAARLIALLPQPAGAANRNLSTLAHFRLSPRAIFFAVILLLLAAQFVMEQ